MKKCIYVGIFYLLSISITQQNYIQSDEREVITFQQCYDKEMKQCVDAGKRLEQCGENFFIRNFVLIKCISYFAVQQLIKASQDDRENTVTDQVTNNSESKNK